MKLTKKKKGHSGVAHMRERYGEIISRLASSDELSPHVNKWIEKAHSALGTELQDLYFSIALRFAKLGILLQCEGCQLSCKQAGVTGGLIKFECANYLKMEDKSV